LLDQRVGLYCISSIKVSKADDRRTVPVENAEADAIKIASLVDRLDLSQKIRHDFLSRFEQSRSEGSETLLMCDGRTLTVDRGPEGKFKVRSG
jgi:hypothetical protein